MKKVLLTILFSMLIPFVAVAQEAYAVYNNGTLTFYYDKQKSSRSGTKYSLNTGHTTPMWQGYDTPSKITKVVFDSSFKNARPTSTFCWFMDFENIQSMDLSNLNTSNVTDMGYMFARCSGLTSLDLGSFDTSNVTDMMHMFESCTGLTSLDLSSFDTSKVTNMTYMFDYCTNLTSLDLSSFNTNKVTAMGFMFKQCWSLTSIDLSSFDTSKVTNMGAMFVDCRGLTSLDLSSFDTSNVTYMAHMFDNCCSLTSLDLSHFDTSKVTNMAYMFSNCSGLTSLDVSHFDTSNVTTMQRMFKDCSSLTSLYLTHFNTSKVTDMSYLFYGCKSLTSLDVSHFNTSNVTTMKNMFSNCSGLTSLNLNSFDTNKVTDMGSMFGGCSGLTLLDLSPLNTSNVIDMSGMFSGCSGLTSLDLRTLNTSKVTNMGAMFSYCRGLTSLDLSPLNTSKVTNMKRMFGSCSGLISLDLSSFDTNKVTDMGYMFESCIGLTSLNLSSFDTSNVTDMRDMFYYCRGLTSLDLNSFNTSNVMDMNYMFWGCSGLMSLDLTPLNTSNVTDMGGMFFGCKGLITIYVDDSWNTDKVIKSDDMFYGCSNLVGGSGTKYDYKYKDKAYAHIDGGVSNPGYLTGKNTTPALNLQEFINANAGSTSVVDVDLSKFQNDLVREQTLTVSTGASYRFINGKLDRASTLNAPVMSISNNSQVQVADGALITGIEHITDDTSTETIRMAGGYLIVDGGTIEGSVGGRHYTNGIIVLGNAEYDPAVRLTSNSDHFILKDGIVYGAITCDATNADIQLLAGQLRGMGQRTVDESTTQNIARRVSPMGSREPYINTRSDVFISSTTSKNYTWGYIVVIAPGGNSEESQFDPFKMSLFDKSILYLSQGYSKGYDITLYNKYEGDVIAAGKYYSITQEDVERMNVTVRYTEGQSYTEEREPYLELKDNKVYLRYKKEKVCDADDLLRFIENLSGNTTTNDNPAEATLCDEPTIDQDVDIEDDLWLYLYGDDDTTPPVINFYGGAINLKSRNSGWTFKGVGFTCKDGATAPMRAAGNPGGITSMGTLTFDGCTLKEGNYAVQNLSNGRMYLLGGTMVEGYGNLMNSGNAYIDGSVKVADLVNKKDGRIYVTSALTEDVKVSITTSADVEQGVAIILGGNGYTMTSADVSHITLTLPDGFEWKYNEEAGGIVVNSAAGISALEQQKVVVEDYDILGRKVSKNIKGLHIQQMNDGTVKKVITN